MKVSHWLRVCAALLVVAVPTVRAQDAAAVDKSTTELAVPVKLQIVLTEYDGATKISSLPYTIPMVLRNGTSVSSIRVGIRVPVNTASPKTGETSIQYIDVGTNIDVLAKLAPEDRYNVNLKIDRSSMYVPARDKDGHVEGKGKDWATGDMPVGTGEPMIRQFRGDVAVLLRDGQESETAVATDPLSGRVLKVEATLNKVK